ncbi:hypothetical protein [Granulicella aggregans]|uniref:hypothetical protein n=1 Tax=Granulicella aggregans TaxID=474949 RepID=UPI0021E0F899|nr:hypothetical protein [Granulicella aggregans]
METGKKAAIGATVVLILAVGVRVGMIYKSRHEEAKPVEVAQAKMDPDDLVFLKQMRPDSMKDIKELIGKTIWVSAGGQLDYFKYANHKADYAHSAGLLLGADPLVVKDAFEQVAPKTATFRIPGGDRQVLLAFTLPKSSDPSAVYATPVGYHDEGQYTFLTDQIFFYDDPHKLYNWPADVWAAVDAHKVVMGMSERQVVLALGQVSKSQSQDVGNRTVNFDNQGHPVDVTFEHNKVTAIH